MSQTKSQRAARKSPSSFVDATDLLAELAADPEIAELAAVERAKMRAADRVHAMSLAMIRNAAHLTQTELAQTLGVSQVAIAKTEKRPDMLLSTLNSYLSAAGARAVILVELQDGTVAQIALDQAVEEQSR